VFSNICPVGKEANIPGIVVATAMTLFATIGDTLNEHRMASLWFTIFACSFLVLYVSIGAPLPCLRKKKSENELQ
jgi:hypothetical protein